MLKRLHIRLPALLLLFLVSGLVGLALFLPRLIDVNAYRDDIIISLRHELNREVSFGRGAFSMKFGPTFTFDNLAVREKGGGDFLTAKRISVHLALLPLLEKRVVLRTVVVEGADLRLERDAAGRLNIDDLLAPQGLGWKARTQKELALMEDMIPLFRKFAKGREISGLSAYEQ